MDWLLFSWIHGLAGRFAILDETMKALTSYGIYVFIGVLILAACFSKKRAFAFIGISGIVLGLAVNYVITTVYSRPRPFVAHDVIPLIEKAASASFPSDTAVIAFAASFAIWMISREIGWLLIGISVFVAISRIYVGHHYPLDVIVGSMIGLVSTYCCCVIYNRILQQKDNRTLQV